MKLHKAKNDQFTVAVSSQGKYLSFVHVKSLFLVTFMRAFFIVCFCIALFVSFFSYCTCKNIVAIKVANH